jgi:hypothetical protein
MGVGGRYLNLEAFTEEKVEAVYLLEPKGQWEISEWLS